VRGRLAALLVMLVAARAEAHDHWLVPSKLITAEPARLAVVWYVGEEFVAEEEKPFEAARISRALLLNHVARAELHGVDGARPFLDIDVARGGNLLAVDRIPTTIELKPREFEDYLREEDLEGPLAERARRGESNKAGLEKYGRSIKLLVQVGDAEDATYGAEIGQSIEIIPREDPVHLTPGGVLHVLVKFHGAPIEGVRVDALSRGDDNVVRTTSGHTAHDGMVALTLDRRATWMVRLVHMVRCDPACDGMDWQSFWASYVFASARPGVAEIAPPSMIAPQKRSRRAFVLMVVALVIAVALGFVVADQRTRRP